MVMDLWRYINQTGTGLVVSEFVGVSCSTHLFPFLNSYICSNLLCFLTSLGMNTEDFRYNWDGEDWDLLDRVMMLSVEVERIKYPGLYHHYHAKQRKWN